MRFGGGDAPPFGHGEVGGQVDVQINVRAGVRHARGLRSRKGDRFYVQEGGVAIGNGLRGEEGGGSGGGGHIAILLKSWFVEGNSPVV